MRNLENYRKWRRERYKRWRAAGCCVACGIPSAPFHMCRKHRIHESKWKRKRRKQGEYHG